MNENKSLKKAVEEAYSAVEGLSDPEFKLAAFKLILPTLLAHNETPSAPPSSSVKNTETQPEITGNWSDMIARKLGLEREQVLKIYHMDGEDNLRVILDLKLLPKASSAATQHIAALVAAGRQAAKQDSGSTSFEVIRAECEEYGVLNKSNFTVYLNKMKPKFQVDGKGRNQALRVTAPGFGEASEIAKSYVG